MRLTILQNLVGVLAAGRLALAAGIGPPYWAVVGVVAVLLVLAARGQARLTECVLTRCALTTPEVHRLLSASP